MKILQHKVGNNLRERNYSIDSLKFFCIFGVICIHTAPFKGMELIFTGSQYLSIIINTVARVSVPIFFISSGYLFYERCSKEYTKKYTMKLLKVLIIWSIVYILYDIVLIISENISNSREIFTGIWQYISDFNILDIYYATGIIHYHLWYLTVMIITQPLLYLIIKNKLLDKAIILGLFLNIVGVLIPVLINIDLWYNVRDVIFFSIFYCMLGSIIKKYEELITEKVDNILYIKYIAIIVLGFMISIVERKIYISRFNGAGDYYLSTIPLSIILFCLCLKNKNLFKNTIIEKIGRNTLGIYVIHPLIMNIVMLGINKFNIDWLRDTVLWQVLYSPMILILSYIMYDFLMIIKEYILLNKLFVINKVKEKSRKKILKV